MRSGLRTSGQPSKRQRVSDAVIDRVTTLETQVSGDVEFDLTTLQTQVLALSSKNAEQDIKLDSLQSDVSQVDQDVISNDGDILTLESSIQTTKQDLETALAATQLALEEADTALNERINAAMEGTGSVKDAYLAADDALQGQITTLNNNALVLNPDLDLNFQRAINVFSPVNALDAANKQYVDALGTANAALYLPKTGGTMTGWLDMGGLGIANVSDFNTTTLTFNTNDVIFNGVVDMSLSKASVADPLDPSYAVNKQYVDTEVTQLQTQTNDRLDVLEREKLSLSISFDGGVSVPISS